MKRGYNVLFSSLLLRNSVFWNLSQNELVNITMKALKEDGASKNNLKFLLTNTTENTLPNSRSVW